MTELTITFNEYEARALLRAAELLPVLFGGIATPVALPSEFNGIRPLDSAAMRLRTALMQEQVEL